MDMSKTRILTAPNEDGLTLTVSSKLLRSHPYLLQYQYLRWIANSASARPLDSPAAPRRPNYTPRSSLDAHAKHCVSFPVLSRTRRHYGTLRPAPAIRITIAYPLHDPYQR